MSHATVTERLDQVVDEFATRTKVFHQEFNPEGAKLFVQQHRLNSRYRNSVLKLRVATNTPIWEIKLRIIGGCAEEIIADHEHGDGRAHWDILEDLGVRIGVDRETIRNAEPTPNTRICWLAWEALMSNRHWLEGLIANTCAERMNLPGYGTGRQREIGWSGVQREQWQAHFGLTDAEVQFFHMHSEADIAHSNLGWNTVAQYASELHMEDAVVEACRQNLYVWEQYFNGIFARK